MTICYGILERWKEQCGQTETATPPYSQLRKQALAAGVPGWSNFFIQKDLKYLSIPYFTRKKATKPVSSPQSEPVHDEQPKTVSEKLDWAMANAEDTNEHRLETHLDRAAQASDQAATWTRSKLIRVEHVERKVDEMLSTQAEILSTQAEILELLRSAANVRVVEQNDEDDPRLDDEEFVEANSVGINEEAFLRP